MASMDDIYRKLDHIDQQLQQVRIEIAELKTKMSDLSHALQELEVLTRNHGEEIAAIKARLSALEPLTRWFNGVFRWLVIIALAGLSIAAAVMGVKLNMPQQ